MSQMRIWINEQKKEENMIRRSVDYRQDLTNQIRLCKFLVGDTPSVYKQLQILQIHADVTIMIIQPERHYLAHVLNYYLVI